LFENLFLVFYFFFPSPLVDEGGAPFLTSLRAGKQTASPPSSYPFFFFPRQASMTAFPSFIAGKRQVRTLPLFRPRSLSPFPPLPERVIVGVSFPPPFIQKRRICDFSSPFSSYCYWTSKDGSFFPASGGAPFSFLNWFPCPPLRHSQWTRARIFPFFFRRRNAGHHVPCVIPLFPFPLPFPFFFSPRQMGAPFFPSPQVIGRVLFFQLFSPYRKDSPFSSIGLRKDWMRLSPDRTSLFFLFR